MEKISKAMYDRISDMKFLADRNNVILSEPASTEKKLEYLKSVLRIDGQTYTLARLI